jgi:hypothetical protein
MSWLFSQALVEEYSEGNCLDGDAFVQLSTNHIPQRFSRSDKMTAFSRLSRFGMTFAPLTADRGEAVLMSFLAAFPAKTSQSRGEAKASTENEADFGAKWHASLAKYDRDTSSWRTHQHSLLGGLDEFSETWPRWGSMRSGECWERPTLERLTEESESGLWATPLSQDAKHSGHAKSGPGNADKLAYQAVRWPTPVASMHKGSSPNSLIRKSGRDRSNDRLDHAVMASNGGRLNPQWVEWLMGWPLGWTDLKPSETGKSHSALLKHSESCSGG